LVLPKSRRRYRTGRFLARAFTVIGFVETAIGVLLIGAGLFARGSGAAALPDALAAYQQVIGVSLGLSVLAFGLVQVLGGQLARAMFDTASANRDLAAYARARAIFDAGGVDEHPPKH
jgi:ABC-type thiamin/hydroxymethylpyrimidine transport system permease subunit